MASPDTPSILPPVKPDVFQVPFSITQDDVDWLDATAERLNRTRSELVREIFANLREHQQKGAA